MDDEMMYEIYHILNCGSSMFSKRALSVRIILISLLRKLYNINFKSFRHLYLADFTSANGTLFGLHSLKPDASRKLFYRLLCPLLRFREFLPFFFCLCPLYGFSVPFSFPCWSPSESLSTEALSKL